MSPIEKGYQLVSINTPEAMDKAMSPMEQVFQLASLKRAEALTEIEATRAQDEKRRLEQWEERLKKVQQCFDQLIEDMPKCIAKSRLENCTRDWIRIPLNEHYKTDDSYLLLEKLEKGGFKARIRPYGYDEIEIRDPEVSDCIIL